MPPKRPACKRRRKDNDATDRPNLALTIAKPVKRGKAGKLEALTRMPLDVLYEIFSYLNTPDVLKLSRMSKAFRRVLMNSSSISIWRNARENIGLPKCPPDMVEPEWANLAFSPYCHSCFTTGVRTVEWRFRMRICSKCAKDRISEVQYMPSIDGIASENLVPFRPASRRWRFVYVTSELEKVREQIYIMNASDLAEYLLKRKERVTQIMQHAEKCEIWAQDQNNDRALERDRLRTGRRNAIVEKLKALGWEKDLESIRRPDSLDDHKLVRMPQRLTERIWGNIQGHILQFMAEMRKKRIDREEKEISMRRKRVAMTILQEFKNDRLPYIEVMPEAFDFCNMEPVKAIIDQPLDVSVDATSFSHLITQLPQLFDSWRDEIRLKLSHLLRQESELPSHFLFDDDSDVVSDYESRKSPETDAEALEMLNLASTIFVCRECGPSLFTFLDMSLDRPIFHPEVLGHTCLTRRYSFTLLHNDPVDPSVELNTPSLKRTSWDRRPLMLSSRLRRVAEDLISDSGLDPQVATAANMDELNFLYACMACSELHCNGELMAPVYKWRDAVCHQAAEHDLFESEWFITNQDEFDMNIVDSDEEEDDYDGGGEAMYPIWFCTRCRDTPHERGPMTLPSMSDHYLFQHEFYGGLVLDRDYYRSFDAHKREYSSPHKMFIMSM